ncbi:MAG: class I SAM-dependent methyltransferase [Acidihalobacter sp.]
MKKEYYEDNLKLWDERANDHLDSPLYDMDSFLRGETSLRHIELEALGDVRGKSILHLQCHFGQDSLSLARLGAKVTGIDFSESAIATAKRLNAELGLDGTFIQSDVYELPEKLDERFDIVFTSYGVLKWLNDIDKWGEIVTHFIRAGGSFFIVEFHPFMYVFDYDRGERISYSYFVGEEPITYEEVGTYANPEGGRKIRRAHSWPHPVSKVLTSLINAGLSIDSFVEYPYTTINCFPFIERIGEQKYVHDKHPEMIPFLYSISATKKSF